MEWLLTTVVALMIAGALIALESRSLLSAIICVGAVGFLAAFAFVLLGAPDLAIAQVAVEILGLIILIPATMGSERDEGGGRRLLPTLGVAGAVLVATAASWRLVSGLPQLGLAVMDRFGDAPSGRFLSQGLSETGAANLVTAVLLDYRAYDTLGEASVLFCAVLGVGVILRRSGRSSHPGGAP